jgi:hypothetical protein
MVPFDRHMPTVIRPNQIIPDVTHEPPLRVGFSINDQTVAGATATMGRTILVPGAGPNPTYYHAAHDVCWYILYARIQSGTKGTTLHIRYICAPLRAPRRWDENISGMQRSISSITQGSSSSHSPVGCCGAGWIFAP